MIGSIYTDGAPAMLGNRSGFAATLKKEIAELKVAHCLLYRQALAFKTLPSCLKDGLNSCVKIVNYIKGRVLNYLLFLSLCQDVNQNHNHFLFYHTEVRWLSRGRVLNRFLEIRKEITTLWKMATVTYLFASNLLNLYKMTAYLADIFHHLNEQNLSLKGKGMNMVKASEKLKSFIGKLSFWSRQLQGGNLANFPFLDEIVVRGGASLQGNVQLEIVAHMECLSAPLTITFLPVN